MRSLRHFHLVLLIFAAGCAGLNSGNEILPGVTLYEQEKPLSGRLVFLRSALLGTGGSTTEPPTVYSYDLSTKQLLKVVELEASARLSVALDGSLICADSSMALSIPKRGFFLYQPAAKEGVVVELPWEPKILVPLCKRVFAVGGLYGHMQIAQYDVMRKSVSLLSLPGASQWESQSYHSARWQFKFPCTLFFEYERRGSKLQGGKDYEEGAYAYEIASEEFGRLDTPLSAFVAADGAKIGVDHQNESLMITRVPAQKTSAMDTVAVSRTPGVQVLKELRCGPYSYWSALQTSPNQQFLVVRKEKAYKKNRNVPAWTMTYYLCNLATGEMSLFIKDNGSWYTDYSIARIFWITGGPELPNADTLERSSSN